MVGVATEVRLPLESKFVEELPCFLLHPTLPGHPEADFEKSIHLDVEADSQEVFEALVPLGAQPLFEFAAYRRYQFGCVVPAAVK